MLTSCTSGFQCKLLFYHCFKVIHILSTLCSRYPESFSVRTKKICNSWKNRESLLLARFPHRVLCHTGKINTPLAWYVFYRQPFHFYITLDNIDLPTYYLTQSFRPHYGPGVDSNSNRNGYQE